VKWFGPAVPGGPGGDLPGVQSGDLLRDLVIFLGFSPCDGDPDEPGEGDGSRGPAQEVADGAGVAVPAQEQDGVPVVLAFGGVVGVISIMAQSWSFAPLVAWPVRIRCHIPGFARLAAFLTVRRRPEDTVTL
jgi:hypothetical protein